MIVIGSRIRDLSCEFCNSLKQIGARYDSDKLISAHDRQTLDVLLFHKLHTVFQRRVFRHGAGVKSHDLPDLAASLVHEIRCNLFLAREGVSASDRAFVGSRSPRAG